MSTRISSHGQDMIPQVAGPWITIGRRAWGTSEQVLRLGVAISLGIVAGGLLLLVFGYDPLSVVSYLVSSIVTSRLGQTDTVLEAIPILMIALGVGLCSHGKLVNIGGDGQFYMGGVAAATVALFCPGWPTWLLLPALLLAAALGGAIWAGIAGVLRAYRQVNEVVVTLMLNSVAVMLTTWAVRLPLRDVGSPVEQTRSFVDAAQLPQFAGSRIHIGIIIALIAVPAMWYFLFRTGAGYRIRTVGENADAARAVGVPIKQVILSTFLIAGALSGSAGGIWVSGVSHRLFVGISNNFGYTAILVALMARRHPVGIGLVAFLFTALTVGGQAIQVKFGIPSNFMLVFLGLLLLCVIAFDELQKRKEAA